MRYSRREQWIPLALALAAYVLALLQRPGEASSDTKIDLHVDPSGFLADVAPVWSPTGSLGHVQGGQYGGYLWPMGPFHALLNELGLAPWLVQRLWLGTVLALAAWGAVRLMDALHGRPRGVAHVVAGLVFLLNPYVVVFSNRTSVTLLAYAALPWLLLAVHRGLREPRRWAWPAAFALILTSTSGGVNAAATAWVLAGPLLLLAYEPLVAAVPWRSVRAFGLRAAATTAVACAWWAVPVLVHASYGLDFLRFTEQAGSIWGTTSLTESLRLMGYWPSYLGVGYGDELRPYFDNSPTLLFNPAVVAATLLVPALALAGFAWTRHWRYGPFFIALALLGLLTMSVGYPPGAPLRRAATFAYNHVDAVQFLRTTYKAGPLVALAIACLAGAGAAALWQRIAPRIVLRAAAAAGASALLVLASLPLFQGRAVGTEMTWERIPGAWTQAAADLDRELPRNSRALVLPAQAFAFYRWGGTVDPILPALADVPVAARNTPPYSDLHGVDLLWTVDALVQQRRLLPGQLPQLLELLGARATVTATDDDAERSGALPAAEAAEVLRPQPGFDAPARSYGPQRTFTAPAGSLDPPVSLPQVRRYDLPPGRGIVRVEPAAGQVLVDGSAEGLAALAAFRALPPDRPLVYAGDRDPDELRRFAAGGATVVISDSNRRRPFVASRPRQSTGATLAAGERLSEDAAVLDPFERGSDAQTVAVYRGARHVRAPLSPQVAQFPEQRPYAAFDGDPDTYWLADPTLDDDRHWVEIGLPTRRDVDRIELKPHVDPRATVSEVEVGGRRFRLGPGWNRLDVRLRGVDSVRVRITDQFGEGEYGGAAGGFDEIRVPGVSARELLRPPVRTEQALAGRDLSRTELTYVLARTTADDPFRRGPVPPPPPVAGTLAEAEAALVRGAQDPEAGLDRVISPPAARSWRADAWVTVAPDAPDPALDRLARAPAGGPRFASSGRFQGRPAFRASSAFDGDAGRAWIAPWYGAGPAWIEWGTRRPRTLRRLTLSPGPARTRRPTRVRLVVDGVPSVSLTVGAGGAVVPPSPLRGRAFRLDVLTARGEGAAEPAVGIGELRGPGVPRARFVREGRLVGGCVRRLGAGGPRAPRAASLPGRVGGRRFALRVAGDVADLDAGRPLRARACRELRLPAGRQDLELPPSVLRVHTLRLHSDAPLPRPAPTRTGRVLDPGDSGRGEHHDLEVEVDEPSWLVLGESYNRGWRASCDGRSLGEPEVLDAFANAWRLDRGCRDLDLDFRPQVAVNAGYGTGALACLVLLCVLLLRRPRRLPQRPHEPLPEDDRPQRLPLRRALLAGAAAGAVLGFVFALRAGVVIGPAVAFVLWRGIPARQLALAAGALLVLVVPALYLIFPADDRGGYNTGYAANHVEAHWVAVGAMVLLMLALARTLAGAVRARQYGQAPVPSPSARASGRSRAAIASLTARFRPNQGS